MAVKDLIAAIGDVVPDEIKEVSNGLQYRDFITVGLLLNKLKIKNETSKLTLFGPCQIIGSIFRNAMLRSEDFKYSTIGPRIWYLT